MERITKGMLENLCQRVNATLGVPAEPWTNGKANTGTIYIQGAYGGYQAQQIANDSGGIVSITQGYQPKQAVYYQLKMFLEGIGAGKGET